MVKIDVLAGQKRERVGRVPAAVGMLTSRGRIGRISWRGTVYTTSADAQGVVAERRTLDASKLSTRLTEARKFGYPNGEGCEKLKEVLIRRRKQLVSA